jgi:hypothetical protein
MLIVSMFLERQAGNCPAILVFYVAGKKEEASALLGYRLKAAWASSPPYSSTLFSFLLPRAPPDQSPVHQVRSDQRRIGKGK